MTTPERFISGYRLYKATTMPGHLGILRHKRDLGEKPHSLVITSCSMPVGVETLFNASPREIYTIRNLGGIVPKYNTRHASGIIAAIEYALIELEVKNIILLNHSHCDGVKMLMDDRLAGADLTDETKSAMPHIKAWLDGAKVAKDAIARQLQEKSKEYRADACEREMILFCLQNLLEYPVVRERIAAKAVAIFGWHFNVETGDLAGFNPRTGQFDSLQ